MPKDYPSAQRTMEEIRIHEDAIQVLSTKGADHYAPAIETLTKETDRLKGSFEAKPSAPAPAAAPKRRR